MLSSPIAGILFAARQRSSESAECPSVLEAPPAVIAEAKNHGVRIYPIGIDKTPKSDHAALKPRLLEPGPIVIMPSV